MFKLKDKVIYPGHGLAEIEDIIKKMISGREIKMYKLNFLYKDMNILLPINGVQTSGLRFLCNPEEIKEAFERFYNSCGQQYEVIGFTPSAWNKRNKEYQLKIQMGNIEELLEIYRDLMYVSLQKDLSFGEKKILQLSKDLITQEVMAVIGISKQEVLEKLQVPFRKVFFHGSNVQQVSSSL